MTYSIQTNRQDKSRNYHQFVIMLTHRVLHALGTVKATCSTDPSPDLLWCWEKSHVHPNGVRTMVGNVFHLMDGAHQCTDMGLVLKCLNCEDGQSTTRRRRRTSHKMTISTCEENTKMWLTCISWSLHLRATCIQVYTDIGYGCNCNYPEPTWMCHYRCIWCLPRQYQPRFHSEVKWRMETLKHQCLWLCVTLQVSSIYYLHLLYICMPTCLYFQVPLK